MTESDGQPTSAGGGSGGVDLGIPGYVGAVEVGRGGFAVVYRARRVAFAQTVAVKLLGGVGLDPQGLARFDRERVALGSLAQHPHIVTVYDGGRAANGTPFLVMEFLTGGSLAQVVDRDGRLGVGRVLDIGVKIAGAVETAHRAGVLHRDIKPENVLVSGYGEPLLADFGIARVLGAAQTASGVVTASVAHAPPEILAGRPASVQADVYALASTLFCLLAGEAAFVRAGDESVLAVLARVVHDPVPDLRPNGVPAGLCAVLEQAMAKDPVGRQPTALEFGSQLQRVQRELGLRPSPLLLEGQDVAAAAAAGVSTAVLAGAGAPAQSLLPPSAPPSAPPPPPPAPPTPPSRPPRARFPVPATGLVGRERELEELLELLGSGVRLVCVTGPGGVGKTRLLLALAQRLSAKPGEAEDPDEVCFVDLSPLADPELVLPTIANALGVLERGERALLDALTDALGARRLVVLLDNFEQVLPAAPVVATVLSRCAGVRLVVTSRERLGLGGEQEFLLAPLAGPQAAVHGVEQIASYPAVRLFCERVRAVQRGFVLSEANAAAVGELCRRLDGLPLALELAAARVKLLSPAALVARLDRDRRGVLSGGARDLPARHRTLETTIGWSYDGLTGTEQRVLQACSVFAGAASIEAIESVCSHVCEDMLAQISSLLDKSLLVRRATDTDTDTDADADADTPRITMLETVRGFAADRLDASGESGQLRERHARYYAELVAGARTGLWVEYDRWMARLDADIDNIRAALAWSPTAGDGEVGARMLVDLSKYWDYRGALAEGSRWLTQAVDRTPADSTVGAAIRVFLADIEMIQGNLTGWVPHLPEALNRLAADSELVAYCLGARVLSHALHQQGRWDEAILVAERCVETARTLELPLLLSGSLTVLGVSWAEHGHPDRGLQALIEAADLIPPSLADYRRVGLLTNLGWAEILNGRHGDARDHLLSVLSTGAIDDRDLYDQAVVRINLGWATLGTGETQQALAHFLEAVRHCHRLENSYAVAEALAGVGCAAADLRLPVIPGLAFGLAASLAEQAGSLSPYVVDRQGERTTRLDPVQLERDLLDGPAHSPLELVSMAESATAAQPD